MRSLSLCVLALAPVLLAVGAACGYEEPAPNAPPPFPILTHELLLQGFETDDVFAKKEHVSYLSGVPEDAQVELWDMPLYNRQKLAFGDEGGVAVRFAGQNVKQGKAALEARFARGDRALRVSLRNNLDQPAGPDGQRGEANGLGWFDRVVADVFNPAPQDVQVEVRLLGGYALTDKSLPLSLARTVTLKSGWNEIQFSAAESSKCLVDPFDAAAIELRVPQPKDTVLVIDNLRVERQTLPKKLSQLARCFDFGVSYFNWHGFDYGSLMYDQKRGYGFVECKDITHGGDLHVMNDALTRDGFRAPAKFKVKLANGKYRCVAQTGNYWGRRDHDLNLEIKAEGKTAWSRPRLSPEERWKEKFADETCDHWKHGLDLWNTYEDGKYFKTIQFVAEVADGELDIEWLLPPLPAGEKPGGESIWTWLVIYPEDRHKELAPELAWLNDKIADIYSNVMHVQIGREFALYNREEVIVAEEYLWPDLAAARKAAIKPTADEEKRGYLHFLRHQADLLTPHSVPLPSEVGDRIELVAAPGTTAAPRWASIR